jgi:hypothetical protein
MKRESVLAVIEKTLMAKRADLQLALTDLQQGMADDTKSSAGDKYETARAMSQQEMEKIGSQLAETNRQLALLSGLKDLPASETIQNGSLVKIDSGTLFIGIPLGQLIVEEQLVFCISAAAPLAQALLGKKVGELYNFQGKPGKVLGVK